MIQLSAQLKASNQQSLIFFFLHISGSLHKLSFNHGMSSFLFFLFLRRTANSPSRPNSNVIFSVKLSCSSRKILEYFALTETQFTSSSNILITDQTSSFSQIWQKYSTQTPSSPQTDIANQSQHHFPVSQHATSESF